MVSIQRECDSFCYCETFKKVYIYTCIYGHTCIYIYTCTYLYIHILNFQNTDTQKSIFTISVELDEFSQRKQQLLDQEIEQGLDS